MKSQFADAMSGGLSPAWSKWNLYVAAAVGITLVIGFSYIKWLEPLNTEIPRSGTLRVADPEIPGRAMVNDEIQYLSIAKCVARGIGYQRDAEAAPTALRGPGYPLYVAAAFKLFGPSIRVALLANLFLIALLPLLAFALAKPAFGFKAAVLASFFCAFNPGLYFFGVSSALSEPLFAVLLCAATVAWQRADGKYGLAFAASAGVLYGAATLTRTGYLALPILLLLAETTFRRRAGLWKNGIALCLAFSLIVSVWAIRNSVMIGAPVLSSTNDGVTLLGTVLAAKQGRGDWLNPADADPQYAPIESMSDETTRNSIMKRAALVELKSVPPLVLVKAATKRVLRFWVPLNRIVSDELSLKANIAANLLYLPAMLLAGLGLWWARHNPYLASFLAMLVYPTLLAAISWGGTRFRYGIEPMLAGFAAYGLVEAAHRTNLFFSASSLEHELHPESQSFGG